MIASIFQDSYEIDQQFACHIHGLWVHPDYRKRGIAKDLKARGEAWAKKMGCKFMDTNVRVGNEPMKSLNESLGYEVARLNYRKNL
jgi:ribosomal protein S18 acetylase RimI-like enzyme